MNNSLKFLYTTLLYLIQPIIWLSLLFYSRKVPAYRYRLSERYGFCKNKVIPEGILLHSVSLGETIAAIPLIQALRGQYPYLAITVTTMTPSSSEQIISVFGKEVHHVYLPYDLPCAMNRFLNTVRPKIAIVMETELWPNMISELYVRKIPLIIVNARLSKRSAEGYSKLGNFMRNLLSKVTLIAAQNDEDGARFVSLGLKRNQLVITGNLKFDISLTSELTVRANMLRHRWSALNRKVWIATSTHSGEEIIILKAYRKLLEKFSDLLLILVPRHQERFKEVCKIVQKYGFNFILRSTGEIPSNNTQVIIGDTIGELMLLYGVADLAFVGGSLVKCGGHNPLEAAAHSIPILMGPHIFNFKDICNKLKLANGLITVIDIKSIVKEISNLFTDRNYYLWYSSNAIKVLRRNQGSVLRLLKFLQPFLP